LAEVSDDQFSLAIGKKGQNVRLAAKLTGWRIDVRAPQAQMLAEEALTPLEVTAEENKSDNAQEFRPESAAEVRYKEPDISGEEKEKGETDEKLTEEAGKSGLEKK
jgi:N utilization substance protein A